MSSVHQQGPGGKARAFIATTAPGGWTLAEAAGRLVKAESCEGDEGAAFLALLGALMRIRAASVKAGRAADRVHVIVRTDLAWGTAPDAAVPLHDALILEGVDVEIERPDDDEDVEEDAAPACAAPLPWYSRPADLRRFLLRFEQNDRALVANCYLDAWRESGNTATLKPEAALAEARARAERRARGWNGQRDPRYDAILAAIDADPVAALDFARERLTWERLPQAEKDRRKGKKAREYTSGRAA